MGVRIHQPRDQHVLRTVDDFHRIVVAKSGGRNNAVYAAAPHQHGMVLEDLAGWLYRQNPAGSYSQVSGDMVGQTDSLEFGRLASGRSIALRAC